MPDRLLPRDIVGMGMAIADVTDDVTDDVISASETDGSEGAAGTFTSRTLAGALIVTMLPASPPAAAAAAAAPAAPA
jgi:hypothetical protein